MEVPACGMVHLQTRITESCSFYYALCTWWKEAGRKEKYKNVAHSNSKIFQPCLFLYSPKHITAAVFLLLSLACALYILQSHEQQCQAVTAGSCKLPLFCSVYRQPFLFSLSQQVMQQCSSKYVDRHERMDHHHTKQTATTDILLFQQGLHYK